MKRRMKWAIGLCIVALVLIWLIISNKIIQTSTYNITNSKIPVEFNDFTIVQVSDLHNTEFGKQQSKLLEKIRTQHPNIIVITGDVIDSTNLDHAIKFVEQAMKLAPIYYISGNHEAWLIEYPTLKARLESAGVIVLEDQFQLLKNGRSAIAIIGLQDPDMHSDGWSDDDYKSNAILNNQLSEMLQKTKPYYSIVLSHRPELFDLYVKNQADLVLTGHAHGGQVRLPFIGGLVAPNQGLFPKYTAGRYTKDCTTMLISRGLGNSLIPVRVNNCPELVVVKLHGE